MRSPPTCSCSATPGRRAWCRSARPRSCAPIELNGAAVGLNQAAFQWGRRAAHDLAQVERLATPAGGGPDNRRLSTSLDEVIARRVDYLTAYQDAAYADRYRALVEPGAHGRGRARARAAPR